MTDRFAEGMALLAAFYGAIWLAPPFAWWAAKRLRRESASIRRRTLGAAAMAAAAVLALGIYTPLSLRGELADTGTLGLVYLTYCLLVFSLGRDDMRWPRAGAFMLGVMSIAVVCTFSVLGSLGFVFLAADQAPSHRERYPTSHECRIYDYGGTVFSGDGGGAVRVYWQPRWLPFVEYRLLNQSGTGEPEAFYSDACRHAEREVSEAPR